VPLLVIVEKTIVNYYTYSTTIEYTLSDVSFGIPKLITHTSNSMMGLFHPTINDDGTTTSTSKNPYPGKHRWDNFIYTTIVTTVKQGAIIKLQHVKTASQSNDQPPINESKITIALP